MSDAPTPDLDKQLAELTAWHGPVLGLWRRALNSADAQRASGRKSSLLRQRVPSWLVGAVAAAAILFVAVMTNLPAVRHARQAGPSPALQKTSPATPETTIQETRENGRPDLATLRYADVPRGGALAGEGARGPLRGGGGGRFISPSTGASSDSERNTDRQVIRKATIELKAKDVRAVFLKASQLLSEAQGEYVQDSSITGEGVHAEANLTLRVAAERLPEVLNELRQLGEVRSEKVTGEDVTGQVVDLEARLRNEQRVETELLALLEARKNSPLKEILELRNSISGVRQTIEQLTAQRERLGRLVALATVLVIIRPVDAPPPVETGAWTDFANALRRSVSDGVRFLTRTLAGLVGIAIGGLIWWILLIVAVLVVRAYVRRPKPSA